MEETKSPQKIYGNDTKLRIVIRFAIYLLIAYGFSVFQLMGYPNGEYEKALCNFELHLICFFQACLYVAPSVALMIFEKRELERLKTKNMNYTWNRIDNIQSWDVNDCIGSGYVAMGLLVTFPLMAIMRFISTVSDVHLLSQAALFGLMGVFAGAEWNYATGAKIWWPIVFGAIIGAIVLPYNWSILTMYDSILWFVLIVLIIPVALASLCAYILVFREPSK